MFKEFLKVEKCHAKFCWLRPDGTTHEERFLLTKGAMNELEHSKGYQLNAPVLRASFCGGPIPESLLQGRSITSYMFRDVVELFRYIMDIFPEGDEDIIPGIYVTGGWYPYGDSREFGLERPSKDGLPYVYVGKPWHPTVCIYYLREDGYAIKVEDSKMERFDGPMRVELSKELIHKIQLSLQRNPFYKG